MHQDWLDKYSRTIEVIGGDGRPREVYLYSTKKVYEIYSYNTNQRDKEKRGSNVSSIIMTTLLTVTLSHRHKRLTPVTYFHYA